MTPQDQWILQKERVLAWLRVGFAIVAVGVILCNPERVARFPLLSYVSLGSFLIYSLAILHLATRERTYPRAVGLITTCLDMVWISFIVFSTGGAATPFFVYYFFPIITASSRYGMKGALGAAVVGVSPMDSYDFILTGKIRSVSTVSLCVAFISSSLAYIFGFLSEFESKQNQKLMALSKTAGAVATLEERRRITQELHDGLLQSLATLILRLEACRRKASRISC